MTPEAVIQQIRDVITQLMISGLVDHQHYPALKNVGNLKQIGIQGAPDLSISLRNLEYSKVFLGLHSAGAYHLRLIDGALVQFLYCFGRSDLRSHRLCYFPSPALATYDEAAQLYNDDALFAEIFSSITVRTPIRFDYSSSDEEYIEVNHPRSHLTIGQYKGCRIPVNSPVTPFRFMRFILRNFYNSAYENVNFDDKAELSYFPESISEREKSIFHVRA